MEQICFVLSDVDRRLDNLGIIFLRKKEGPVLQQFDKVGYQFRVELTSGVVDKLLHRSFNGERLPVRTV